MTKTPKPNRTTPLDRDGDGRDGGSLPGNKTAPMAKADDMFPPEADKVATEAASPAQNEAEDQATATDVRAITALEFLDAHGRRPTSADFQDTNLIAPLLDSDVGKEDQVLGRVITQDDVDAQYVRAQPAAALQNEKLETIERETDEANAAVRETAGWTRDNARLSAKLSAINMQPDVGFGLPVEPTVETWTDQEAFGVETFADAMAAEGRYTDNVGDLRNADHTAIDLPSVLGDWILRDADDTPDYYVTIVVIPREADEPLAFGVETNIPGLVVQAPTLKEAGEVAVPLARELLTDVGVSADAIEHITFRITPEAQAAEWEQLAGLNEDTFTAEEIAAGKTPVVQEDEAEVTASESAVFIDPADALITVETATAPIAVRLEDVRRLVANRFLYKTPHGYSPNTHPPYIDQASVEAMVGAGLAEWRPDAGSHGGVRVTPEARSALNRTPTVAP